MEYSILESIQPVLRGGCWMHFGGKADQERGKGQTDGQRSVRAMNTKMCHVQAQGG